MPKKNFYTNDRTPNGNEQQNLEALENPYAENAGGYVNGTPGNEEDLEAPENPYAENAGGYVNGTPGNEEDLEAPENPYAENADGYVNGTPGNEEDLEAPENPYAENAGGYVNGTPGNEEDLEAPENPYAENAGGYVNSTPGNEEDLEAPENPYAESIYFEKPTAERKSYVEEIPGREESTEIPQENPKQEEKAEEEPEYRTPIDQEDLLAAVLANAKKVHEPVAEENYVNDEVPDAVEAQRLVDEAKRRIEQRRERQRLAEEARKREEQRLEDKTRTRIEQKLVEEARRREEQRLEGQRLAEEARRREEQGLENQRLVEEVRRRIEARRREEKQNAKRDEIFSAFNTVKNRKHGFFFKSWHADKFDAIGDALNAYRAAGPENKQAAANTLYSACREYLAEHLKVSGKGAAQKQSIGGQGSLDGRLRKQAVVQMLKYMENGGLPEFKDAAEMYAMQKPENERVKLNLDMLEKSLAEKAVLPKNKAGMKNNSNAYQELRKEKKAQKGM